MESDFNSISYQEKKAFNFIKNGKYEEAEKLYRILIADGSLNSVVYTNLAALLQIKGNRKENIQLLKKALYLNPEMAEAHSNLGLEFAYIGDIDNAILSYNSALKINPYYVEAYNNKGQSLELKGEKDLAIECYKKAIEINSNYAIAYFNLGNVLKAKKDFDLAIKKYLKAISINSNFKEAYNNLGLLFYETENYKDAINNLKSALNIDPNFLDALCNLGNAFYKSKEFNMSIKYYKKALKINNTYVQILNNLGNVYKDIERYEDAIENYKRAIEFDKDYYLAYCNLGKVYQLKDNLELGRKYYLHALNINQNHLETLNNLGILNQIQGNISKAKDFFLRCIELDPKFQDAQLNLAYIQLLMGDYTNGWINFEWRKKVEEPLLVHCFPQSEAWDGKDNLIDNKLLVVSEQGLGDNFHFMRYINYLRDNGFDVRFCAPKKLHSLIISSKISLNPITLEQGKFYKESKWISIFDLPKILKVSENNPLINKPYLYASPKLVEKWRPYFKNENERIIGINWQGNPKVEKENLKGRSIPLKNFENLFNSEFKYLSLQRGYGSESLKSCKFKNKFVSFQKHTNKIRDFGEIAALIQNCSLIITSDSCLAHIAGGMGKETWLILHFVPDWRWGLNSESTFWYPSVKIFRQKVRNDWKEVFERIRMSLRNLK